LQADDFLPGIIIKDLNLSTFFSSIYSFLVPLPALLHLQFYTFSFFIFGILF